MPGPGSGDRSAQRVEEKRERENKNGRRYRARERTTREESDVFTPHFLPCASFGDYSNAHLSLFFSISPQRHSYNRAIYRLRHDCHTCKQHTSTTLRAAHSQNVPTVRTKPVASMSLPPKPISVVRPTPVWVSDRTPVMDSLDHLPTPRG